MAALCDGGPPRSTWLCERYQTQQQQPYNRQLKWVGTRTLRNINPLDPRGNHSATSNNIKLVLWPLIGGLLHFGTARRGLGGAPACPGWCGTMTASGIWKVNPIYYPHCPQIPHKHSQPSEWWRFEDVCIPLHIMNCLFPIADSTYSDRAFLVTAVRIWNSLPQHISISHLLHYFPSSAVARRHTSSNCVTHNNTVVVPAKWHCHLWTDTLIALTYLQPSLSHLPVYL